MQPAGGGGGGFSGSDPPHPFWERSLSAPQTFPLDGSLLVLSAAAAALRVLPSKDKGFSAGQSSAHLPSTGTQSWFSLPLTIYPFKPTTLTLLPLHFFETLPTQPQPPP